jgi:hypothetical protein
MYPNGGRDSHMHRPVFCLFYFLSNGPVSHITGLSMLAILLLGPFGKGPSPDDLNTGLLVALTSSRLAHDDVKLGRYQFNRTRPANSAELRRTRWFRLIPIHS